MALKDQLIGLQIGNYQLEERIGSGGMGVVYRAENKTFGKTVAIKFLHPQFAADEEIVERFRREASVLSELEHPSIIREIDFGHLPNLGYYLVMEYLEGKTLKEIIKEEKILSTERVLSIFEQILAALEEAHSKGIVHRDLKPENIFVLQKRGKDQIKLLDFGIARITYSDARQNFTNPGDVYGSPAYMSPEQAKGEIDLIDHRTDLYCVSVMFVEALTGMPPFVGKSATEVMLAHLTKVPPTFRELNPQLSYPEEIDLIIQKGLAKNNYQRFSSARDFRKVLRRLFPLFPFEPLGIEFIPSFPSKEEQERIFSSDSLPPLNTQNMQAAIHSRNNQMGFEDEHTQILGTGNQKETSQKAQKIVASKSSWDAEVTKQLDLEKILQGIDEPSTIDKKLQEIMKEDEEQSPTHQSLPKVEEPLETKMTAPAKSSSKKWLLLPLVLVLVLVPLFFFVFQENTPQNKKRDVLEKTDWQEKGTIAVQDASRRLVPERRLLEQAIEEKKRAIVLPEKKALEIKYENRSLLPEKKGFPEKDIAEKSFVFETKVKKIEQKKKTRIFRRKKKKKKLHSFALKIVTTPSKAHVLNLRRSLQCVTPCSLSFSKYKKVFLLVQKSGYRVHPIRWNALRNKTIYIQLTR